MQRSKIPAPEPVKRSGIPAPSGSFGLKRPTPVQQTDSQRYEPPPSTGVPYKSPTASRPMSGPAPGMRTYKKSPTFGAGQEMIGSSSSAAGMAKRAQPPQQVDQEVIPKSGQYGSRYSAAKAGTSSLALAAGRANNRSSTKLVATPVEDRKERPTAIRPATAKNRNSQ